MPEATSAPVSSDPLCRHLISVGARDSRCDAQMIELAKQLGEERMVPIRACFLAASDKESAETCLAPPSEGDAHGFRTREREDEAKKDLESLYGALKVIQEKQRYLPAVPLGPTPPIGLCCRDREACAQISEDFSSEEWAQIGFAPASKTFSYQYLAPEDGGNFAVQAYGDLDCDGRASTFRLEGNWQKGKLMDAKLESLGPESAH